MKKKTILTALVIFLLLIVSYYIYSHMGANEKKITSNEVYVVKLTSASGGSFVEGAGYYEGALNLVGVKNNITYNLFACSNSWEWVKVGNCYNYNDTDVKSNINSHISSGMLSGCYVGTLEETRC